MRSTLFSQVINTMKFCLFSGMKAMKFSIDKFKKFVYRIPFLNCIVFNLN